MRETDRVRERVRKRETDRVRERVRKRETEERKRERVGGRGGGATRHKCKGGVGTDRVRVRETDRVIVRQTDRVRES